MQVGVPLPMSASFEELLSVARAAEDGGLDSVWVADHFLIRGPGRPEVGLQEAWTTLTALATRTERLRLGTLVLSTSFRNPGLVARMAATLAAISDGRVVLGLGCGWHQPEYAAFGYPFDHRVSRFAESLEITARLLRGERVTFHGTYEHVEDAVVLPLPQLRVPVLVAADGPRMLRLTARWADAWNTAWYGAPGDDVRHALAAFDAALEAEGRPAVAVRRTVGVDVRDTSSPAPDPSEPAIAGDLATISRTIAAYGQLGFDEIILRPEHRTPEAVGRIAAAARAARSA
jgi:alkanesulfonate monooxygenase SsuD/methylene tetrahydromethanopterin reductase-like flavin-dependent oxidoreductase (luciferase family)